MLCLPLPTVVVIEVAVMVPYEAKVVRVNTEEASLSSMAAKLEAELLEVMNV